MATSYLLTCNQSSSDFRIEMTRCGICGVTTMLCVCLLVCTLPSTTRATAPTPHVCYPGPTFLCACVSACVHLCTCVCSVSPCRRLHCSPARGTGLFPRSGFGECIILLCCPISCGWTLSVLTGPSGHCADRLVDFVFLGSYQQRCSDAFL